MITIVCAFGQQVIKCAVQENPQKLAPRPIRRGTPNPANSINQ
jgi:hypothetical protein